MKKFSALAALTVLTVSCFANAGSLAGTYAGKMLLLNPFNLASTAIVACKVQIKETGNSGDNLPQSLGYEATLTYDGQKLANEFDQSNIFDVSQAQSEVRVDIAGLKSTVYSGGHADMADFLDVNTVNGEVKELKMTTALGPIVITQTCTNVTKVN
jgi:hypothetical protein